MAESVVSSVAQYLGGQLVQEGKFLGGVEDQIVKIQDEMKRMQCFLQDADARQDESKVVRNRVSEIRELAYDVEDAIGTYILKAKYASFFNPKKYIRLHQIGKEIGMLQSRIQDITRSVETYGFKTTGRGEGTSSTTEMQRQWRQSYPHYDDEDVIGMEDNVKVLLAKLIDKKGPRLVSIAGMGGLGKTTLAKKVYNHGDVKHHFDCCSWSFVSQQVQVRTILQGIIRKVGNPNEVIGLEALKDGELTEKLYKLLEDKRYLVVLDDIWSTGAWDLLKYAFPNNGKGSKIMLTTRNKEVALYVDPSGFLHEPACLTEEESWELFCKKAFFWRNVASTSSSSSLYPPSREVEKMEKLGKEMIKKCGGLPLAVVVLGGLLAMKQSILEWEMVSKDIGRHLNKPQQKQEQHGVLWILSLSYQDLPFYLKPCYLYLGLYPEDTEFHKRELIQMWIAEGFVHPLDRQGATMEEIGEEYLLQLINRSMVQVSKKSFCGKVRICRLHDLMRDLCLQKAKEENFLCTFDGRSYPIGESSSSFAEVESIFKGRMRRHAIHFTSERYVKSMQRLPTTRNPHLRALFLWGRSSKVHSIATLEFVCKEFNFLRVLVLDSMGNYSGTTLPKAIGKLIHLRYLRVKGGSYGKIKVPKSIGNLQNLQFLTLEDVYKLPNVLWKMEQLKYCSVRGDCYNYNAKQVQVDGPKNLTSLELSVWRLEKLQLGKNLRKLVLHDVDISDCKSLHRFSISRADRLQCLSLGFVDLAAVSDDYDWSPLSCCRSLRKLHLGGPGGLKRIPKKWEEFLPTLTKLSLMAAQLEEDPIPTLEMLPNLETLTLEGPTSSNMGAPRKYHFSSKGFGRLQYLRLLEIERLEVLKVEKGALPCLVHLQIRGCRDLRMLPEGLKFITSLKKLEVIDMPDRFTKRLREDGEDWHKIQHIPSIIIR